MINFPDVSVATQYFTYCSFVWCCPISINPALKWTEKCQNCVAIPRRSRLIKGHSLRDILFFPIKQTWGKINHEFALSLSLTLSE